MKDGPEDQQFPDGKLDPSDEGEATMAIGVVQGRIVMRFRKPILWVGMRPYEAAQLAQALLARALEAGWTPEEEPPKSNGPTPPGAGP
jgi:hypothetical protein